jgi:hypothetical protein
MMVQDFAWWSRATKDGPGLHMMVQDFSWWSRTSHDGPGLQRMVRGFTWWSRTSHDGARLHMMVQDFTWWSRTSHDGPELCWVLRQRYWCQGFRMLRFHVIPAQTLSIRFNFCTASKQRTVTNIAALLLGCGSGSCLWQWTRLMNQCWGSVTGWYGSGFGFGPGSCYFCQWP